MHLQLNELTWWLALINGVVWLVCGVIVGWWYARRDWRSFAIGGRVSRLRTWESRHLYERRLLVRLWKDRLPEAGTWFGGISKRHLPTERDGGRARFAAESLRAERVHRVLLWVIPVTMLWSRGWWIVLNLVVGLAVNVPCMIVARYNRVRLAGLNATTSNS